MKTLKFRHPDHKIRVLYGTSAKRDSFASLWSLVQYVDKVHLIQSNNAKSLPIKELEQNAVFIKGGISGIKHNVFEETQNNGNIPKTLKFAFNQCNKLKNREIIVITGSFYVMQEARLFLGFNDEFDPLELNEIITPESKKAEEFESDQIADRKSSSITKKRIQL